MTPTSAEPQPRFQETDVPLPPFPSFEFRQFDGRADHSKFPESTSGSDIVSRTDPTSLDNLQCGGCRRITTRFVYLLPKRQYKNGTKKLMQFASLVFADRWSGGGGGSRTRVRKCYWSRDYMLIPVHASGLRRKRSRTALRTDKKRVPLA